MRKRSKIAVVAIVSVALGGMLWQLLRTPEPRYNGITLSSWLEEYNRAGAMEKTKPISEAIRAMGTNCLPFLLAHLEHRESPIKQKVFRVVDKLPFVKVPVYRDYPYRSPSILALHALDSEATPVLPELQKLFENPDSSFWGMMSLLALGTNANTTLEALCQNTNFQVRTDAISMLAMIKVTPSPHFSWGWNADPGTSRKCLTISWAVPLEIVTGFVNMLKSPDPAVRRASADAIGRYSGPPYGSIARSATIPMLTKALNDHNQEVRESAKGALERIDVQVDSETGAK